MVVGKWCLRHQHTDPSLFSLFVFPLSLPLSSLSFSPSQVTDSPGSVPELIRTAALSEGVLLHQMRVAIFDPSPGRRFVSRYLVSLWLADNHRKSHFNGNLRALLLFTTPPQHPYNTPTTFR